MIRIDVSKKLKFEDSAELNIRHEFRSGEIAAIYGKSGAGKTTLLKIIAGLINPDSGFVEVDGSVWFDKHNKINVPVQQRNIGFVFQDHALFPNMTVMQNMQYAAGKNPDNTHIAHLLKITGLDKFKNIKPANLSGGQKQRTALARALVRKPSLLLLDEPLSSADQETRSALQEEILQLHQEYQFTALLVSHHLTEIETLASEVLWIDNGRVMKAGLIKEIFTEDTPVIKITGTVVKTDEEWMEVVLDQQSFRMKHKKGYQPGDKITLDLNAGNTAINTTLSAGHKTLGQKP